MNIQTDDFYKNLLNSYFKEAHGTKLIQFMTKLDKKEDNFEIRQTYSNTLNQFNEELDGVMEVLAINEISELDLSEDEFLGIVNSGFLAMNPSLIQLKLHDNNDETTLVEMKAYCGEGLIKQKTNKKGMETVREYFKSADLENM